MSLADKLAHGVLELGLQMSADVQAKLLNYLQLIAKWNRVHNLTAVRDSDQMVSAHLLDSLAIVPHLRAGSVLDVGSGAGLPGIPLALMWPQASITLLDSNHKKAAFLRQAVIELKITNATVVCERVESWQPPQAFDVVISRAFSDLPEFVRLAGRLCKPDGRVVAMKGIYPNEELAQLPGNFVVEKTLPLKVPGMTAERHLVLLNPAAA